jgi:hypothetical protein
MSALVDWGQLITARQTSSLIFPELWRLNVPSKCANGTGNHSIVCDESTVFVLPFCCSHGFCSLALFCLPSAFPVIETYLNNVEKKSVNWKSEFQVLTLWKKRIGSNQLRLRPEDTTLANQSAPRRVTYTSLNYEDDNACLVCWYVT